MKPKTGLGYVVWYAALRNLSATRMALVRLIVPVLTALGAVVLLSEAPFFRLILSTIMILGGVAMALTSQK